MEESNNIEIVQPQPLRDEKGRILPGYSGNPKGRPKKIDLITIISNKLNEIAPGEQKSWAERLISGIIEDAVVDKKFHERKLIINYVEGMPKIQVDQNVTLTISDVLDQLEEENGQTVEGQIVANEPPIQNQEQGPAVGDVPKE